MGVADDDPSGITTYSQAGAQFGYGQLWTALYRIPLLLDLLTAEEDRDYEMRFDIDLLAQRLLAATKSLQEQDETRRLTIGYFGASTGAAAAI